MGLFDSLARIVVAPLEVVDEVIAKPIAEAADEVVSFVKGD